MSPELEYLISRLAAQWGENPAERQAYREFGLTIRRLKMFAKSKITGFPVMKINRARLIERMNAAFGCVKYDLGSKPRLGSLPGAGFDTSDCSGFVRWLIYAATGGKVKMPTGSVLQREWCQEQGFKPTLYKHCVLNDSRLRIAFINPGGGKVGHVWLVINGQTIECYGGHGAGRRKWHTNVLFQNVDCCFVLTDELP